MKTSAPNSTPRPAGSAGFTLLEILLVLAIMGIILGIGGPSVLRALRKEGMRAAVSDILEACQQARSTAILTHRMTLLEIVPGTREFRVGAPSLPANGSQEAVGRGEGAPANSAGAGSGFSAALPPKVSLEMVDVNFVEMKDADLVRVRFFPNGTCDEFTIVIRSAENEWRKISLDVLTSTATLEAWR